MKRPGADRFVEGVAATVAAHGLFAPAAGAEALVVAVSGGPDSVAMLLALAELARSGRLALKLSVAHLHHGLRPNTADADQAFVENLAARLGLPCFSERADVPAEAEAARLGVEEAARNARRRFLAEAARRAGARKVALGHTADDRAETVLFNILRGTGVEGLAALGPRAPLDADAGIEIVRPLIASTRREVLEFLEARGQAWREDETNQSDAHTRNRIRRELLPLLRDEFNPKVDEALARLADQAAEASEVLADALDETWRAVAREVPATAATRKPALSLPNGWVGETPAPAAIVIDADDFAALRPWMRGAILRRAVERLGGGLKHMSAERTSAAVQALLAKSVAGPVDLPGGLAATCRRRAIRIEKHLQEGTGQ
jgi:tRNA(Ile)-lysidine synthase